MRAAAPPLGAVRELDVAAPAARQLARDRQPEPGARRARRARRGRGGSARRPPRARRRPAPGPRSSTSIPPGRATTVDVAAAVAQRVLDQRVEHAVEVGVRAVGGRARGRLDGRGPSRRPCRPSARRRGARRRRGRAPRGGASTSPAWESTSSSEMIAASRSSSAHARRRSPRGPRGRRWPRAPPPAAACRPLSGVRSWCEASATKSRWPATRRSSRAVMPLNVVREACAARRCPRPSRARVRSPSATRAAASSSRRSGPAIWRAITTPAARPSPSTSSADRGQAERRAVGRARDRLDALGHPHGADARAPLDHRHGGGEDLLVERVAAAAVLDRLAARSACAISGRSP